MLEQGSKFGKMLGQGLRCWLNAAEADLRPQMPGQGPRCWDFGFLPASGAQSKLLKPHPVIGGLVQHLGPQPTLGDLLLASLFV